MPRKQALSGEDTWSTSSLTELSQDLLALREQLLACETALRHRMEPLAAARLGSAVNLAHYVGLRQKDLRDLQTRLSRMGLSSLGRSETDVLANLDRVIYLLRRLTEPTLPAPAPTEGSPQAIDGRARLLHNAQALFGRPPAHRKVRIMVTLPGSAAHDPSLVDALVASGMDIARINCAHDKADDWLAMAGEVRRAATATGRQVRVLMDLAGPKLRTGPMAGNSAVLHLKVPKDNQGRATAQALLGLRPRGSQDLVLGASTCAGVDPDWLDKLRPGTRVHLVDARGSKRKLDVLERQAGGVLVACDRSVHLAADTVLSWRCKGQPALDTPLHDLPQAPGAIRLRRGDTVWVVPQDSTESSTPAINGLQTAPARITCTLPAALLQVRVGQRIWFDDGRVGGVIEFAGPQGLRVTITQALDSGDKLLPDKGVNLPDTRLDLPALTDKDIQDLDTAIGVADLVGLSFTQSAADVQALQSRLDQAGGRHLGLLLKIETRRGFENLPEILHAAMGSAQAGVMIARGDLAVECGWERLAEVQEEILWACEAAHMPVVWATQVLESLAKTGLPSRAEITDAAMGERAECVMLNKGPHILDAIRTLDDILRRMQEHQTKKRPLLRALKSWSQTAPTPQQATRGAVAQNAEQAVSDAVSPHAPVTARRTAGMRRPTEAASPT